MTRGRPVIVALGCLGLAAGCRGSSPAGSTRIVDSAGVTIALTGAPDASAPWEVTEVMRLGGADTGVMAFLVRPHQVAANSASLLRRFARLGGGPGELRIPGRLSVGQDGTVRVIDYGKEALVVFDSSGAILPQVPFATIGDPLGGVMVMGDTVMIDQGEIEDGVPVRTLRLMVPGDTIELARHSGGTPMTTSARFRYPDGSRYTMRGLPRLFDPWLIWSARRDLVVTASQSSSEVRWFRGGRLTGVLRREIPSVAATVEHVARLYPEGRAMGNRLCIIQPEVLAEQQGIAENLPVIDELALAPDGSIWVRRFTFPDEPSRIDVCSAGGYYRGTLTSVPLPRGFLPHGRFVGTLPHPESGGEILGVFRLTPPPW